MLLLGKNLLGCLPGPLIEYLKALTTSTKTPVLAIILEYQYQVRIDTETPYLSGSVTYEDEQTYYFIVFSCEFIFPSKK
jgi:hypothetical protein